MAHFAKIEDGIVVRVHRVDNQILLDANGNESEQLGIAYLNKRNPGEYVQTSYNTHGGSHPDGKPLRKNYCGKGHIYHPPPIDGFSHPQSFPSWNLDEDTCYWVPPVPYPEGAMSAPPKYQWNEENQTWDERE